jgi:hypothetical protein
MQNFVTIIWCSVRSYMRKFGYWSHKTEQRIVTWEWDGLTAHGWKCSPSKWIRCWEAFWRQARTHRSWEGFLAARRAIKSVVCSWARSARPQRLPRWMPPAVAPSLTSSSSPGVGQHGAESRCSSCWIDMNKWAACGSVTHKSEVPVMFFWREGMNRTPR